jgi:hypothetical protein
VRRRRGVGLDAVVAVLDRHEKSFSQWGSAYAKVPFVYAMTKSLTTAVDAIGRRT